MCPAQFVGDGASLSGNYDMGDNKVEARTQRKWSHVNGREGEFIGGPKVKEWHINVHGTKWVGSEQQNTR